MRNHFHLNLNLSKRTFHPSTSSPSPPSPCLFPSTLTLNPLHHLSRPFTTSIASLSSTSSSSSTTSSTTTLLLPSPPLSPLPSPIKYLILTSWQTYNWNNSSDALTQWLNARWKKTGYVVDKRTVNFVLKMEKVERMRGGDGDGDEIGDVRMGGEEWDGLFVRPLAVGVTA